MSFETIPKEYLSLPQEYKKKLSQYCHSIQEKDIETRLKGETFWISQKIDGHMTVAVFENDEIFLITRGGKILTLPVLEDIKNIFKKHCVFSAKIVCEMHLPSLKNAACMMSPNTLGMKI